MVFLSQPHTQDRDIFNYPEYKLQLYKKMGLKETAPMPTLPQVYIDGIPVGVSDN